MNRQERKYPEINNPGRLKRLAQQVASDPEQPDTMRQAARDIAVSAQGEIDRRSNQ